MKKNIYFIIIFSIISASLFSQTFRVVNMIPNSLSNEHNQDSEPNLTINPNNPLQIIGSAFTPNPTGSTSTAPIFISLNGGTTWVLNNIVPSGNGMTGDITIGLSKNNNLYGGILRGGSYLKMLILRSNNYLNPVTMDILLTRNNVDQPYIETIVPLGGAGKNNDHIYVGNNDFNAASGKTASIEQSLDAATAPAPANLTTERLEVRTTGGQDGPPIRVAIHPNGTIYSIFDRITNISGNTITSDIIVVRDDDWGQGTVSYDNLSDASDGLSGRIIASGITWTFNSEASAMGQVRLGDRMSIAVDPRNSQTVYTVYSDRNPTGGVNSTRIHVMRSTDGGNNWSTDLLTINNAINPQLAVNVRGDVGFLYQVLTGANWVTHFRQSSDGGTSWTDTILHQAPSNTPTVTFYPYLGDYAGLKAVGKDFYGIFSGSNYPDMANFPQSVTYQRNVNFTTHVLRNQTNTADVSVSIDPFFFEVEKIPDNKDFYVRDWTDSSTDADSGLEPSSHPVFYSSSDVWNKRSNAPGSFSPLDRPINQDPQIASLGNNFAFARVHRKGTGSSETVTLHFLKSEFGTGSNYVNAGTDPDPTINFTSTDLSKTMVSGYEWTLNATSSHHTCLAVEISTVDDPIVTPSLLGRAPGWPNTDLSVLYDNNKAQRNMGVFSLSSASSGSITYYAIVHNAATYIRNVILEFKPSRSFYKYFKRPSFEFPVDFGEKVEVGENRIEFLKMKPGENRWIGITVPVNNLKDGNSATINFTEIENNLPINGFSIMVKNAALKDVIKENYYSSAELFFRLTGLFDKKWTSKISDKFTEVYDKDEAKIEYYKRILQKYIKFYNKVFEIKKIEKNYQKDIFKIKKTYEEFRKALDQDEDNISILANLHSKLNQQMDAMITYVDKQNGDIADILQNIRWQNDIFSNKKLFKNFMPAQRIIEKGNSFQKAYQNGRYSDEAYLEFLNDNMDYYRNVGEYLKEEFDINISKEIRAMENLSTSPQKAQKLHYNLLLKVYLSL